MGCMAPSSLSFSCHSPFSSHRTTWTPNTRSHSSIPVLLCLIPHHSLDGCFLEVDTWLSSPGSKQPRFIRDEVCPGRAWKVSHPSPQLPHTAGSPEP